jgi:hypothetical protein
MLGMDAECVVVDGSERPSQDKYKDANERSLIDVTLSIKASRILPERYKKKRRATKVEQNNRPNDVVQDELDDGNNAIGDFFLHSYTMPNA